MRWEATQDPFIRIDFVSFAHTGGAGLQTEASTRARRRRPGIASKEDAGPDLRLTDDTTYGEFATTLLR